MACKKCGSDWVTPTGKDCNRCPGCDKLQRCLARQQGRIPRETQKTCCVCGVEFSATPQRHNAMTCGSESCRKVGEIEKRKRHKEKKRAGLASKMQPRHSSQRRKACKREGCCEIVKDNRHDYCGKTCAGADAREFKRGFMGVEAGVREAAAFAGLLFGWDWVRPRKDRPRKPRPLCETCGKEVNAGSSRFCCYECVAAWRGTRPCDMCGVDVEGCRSYSRARCADCRLKAKRAGNQKAKRKYGRNHRQRARHHGVGYVPVPVKALYERDGYRCQICMKRCLRNARYSKLDGRIHPRSPTIDHIVPMSCGGNHEPTNLQTACFECNSKKGAKACGQLRMAFV